MKILVLNAGSSSQKSRVYEIAEGLQELPLQAPEPLWEATLEWKSESGAAKLRVKSSTGTLEEELPADSRQKAVERMLSTLWSGEKAVLTHPSDIALVGHRVVHGGPDYHDSVRITPEVKAAIKRLAAFAPLHNPPALEGIADVEQALGAVPQVAVFDTAFHSGLPPEASIYPGPYEWVEQGIRRYGFHGISHRYCAQRASQILGRELQSLRLITCHLGNGCSLAAISQGRSIDTTMGLTPLEGLMMGSRSGSVDPSILLYLLREKGQTVDQIEQTLERDSGLKGISGVSNDMRQILAAMQEGNARAKLAFALYIHRLRAFIGAMLATLGGLDALIFAGGVGENAAPVRAEACAAFQFLGLKLDPEKNTRSPADADIATPDSTVRVLIVHTQEDWAIAQECWKFAALQPH